MRPSILGFFTVGMTTLSMSMAARWWSGVDNNNNNSHFTVISFESAAM